MLLKSNIISTTLIYTTPSILRHIFALPNFLVRNYLFCLSATEHTHEVATFQYIVVA